jgi:hypothetical protein
MRHAPRLPFFIKRIFFSILTQNTAEFSTFYQQSGGKRQKIPSRRCPAAKIVLQ